jgi:hypothetical protein
MNTEGARAQGVLNSEKTFSPDEVKRILNSDNQEIQRLCREVCISPKKDNLTGKTFFLRNDVEILRKIKELHNKGQQVMEKQNLSTSPIMVAPKKITRPDLLEKTGIEEFVENIISANDTIVDKISKVIDDKLDGIDEVVVELIKCKSENERLKEKVNQLTKDNYKLKNEIEAYKPLGLGIFLKK